MDLFCTQIQEQVVEVFKKIAQKRVSERVVVGSVQERSLISGGASLLTCP